MFKFFGLFKNHQLIKKPDHRVRDIIQFINFVKQSAQELRRNGETGR